MPPHHTLPHHTTIRIIALLSTPFHHPGYLPIWSELESAKPRHSAASNSACTTLIVEGISGVKGRLPIDGPPKASDWQTCVHSSLLQRTYPCSLTPSILPPSTGGRDCSGCAINRCPSPHDYLSGTIYVTPSNPVPPRQFVTQ